MGPGWPSADQPWACIQSVSLVEREGPLVNPGPQSLAQLPEVYEHAPSRAHGEDARGVPDRPFRWERPVD